MYLAGFVVGIGGLILIQSVLGAPDHLATLPASSTLLAIGAVLWLMAAAWDAAHGVLMFPVLKRHNSERLAAGYLGFRIMDGLLIAIMVLFILIQIPIGSEYLNAGASDASYLQALSAVFMQAQLDAYNLAMTTLGISGRQNGQVAGYPGDGRIRRARGEVRRCRVMAERRNSLGAVSSGRARRPIRWALRALLWLAIALLILAVVGAIYQAIATERAERAYPPPGEMVDVGGYSLHVNCVGQGSPTVVLDAGSGGMSAQWVRVQQWVSDTTRVCAYDRAGMGWSEMGPDPRDARQITGELHTLLGKAGIEEPYVLVGHSFGGMYLQTYAHRYPDEVAGVALVDSSTEPDQFSQRPDARESHEPQEQTFAVVSQLVRLGVSLPARLGVVRLLSELDPASPELPTQQRAQIDALTPSTRQWSTTALEFLAPTQTLRAGGPGSLGSKPLAVVTAGASEPGWLERQDKLATLSSNSIHRVVKGATHTSVLYDRSDSQATSAAIVDVVQAARSDQTLTR